MVSEQFVLGRPPRTEQMAETLLPKRLALPVFCSDPLSSVAYATKEILLILAFAGTAYLHLTWYIAVVIVALLVVVIASYRQTCHAYPNGGGATPSAPPTSARPPPSRRRARCSWTTS